MFCVPGLDFGGTEGGRSHFHVLPARTHFRRYRGRQVSFSCFPLPNSFSVVPRTSHSVFMLSAHGYVFGRSLGVESHFYVLRNPTRFRRYRGRRVMFSFFAHPDSFSAVPRVPNPVFMFSALGHVFGGTAGVGSRFHFSRSRTLFRRYRGLRVPFS
jgi:hypothetical protein